MQFIQFPCINRDRHLFWHGESFQFFASRLRIDQFDATMPAVISGYLFGVIAHMLFHLRARYEPDLSVLSFDSATDVTHVFFSLFRLKFARIIRQPKRAGW